MYIYILHIHRIYQRITDLYLSQMILYCVTNSYTRWLFYDESHIYTYYDFITLKITKYREIFLYILICSIEIYMLIKYINALYQILLILHRDWMTSRIFLVIYSLCLNDACAKWKYIPVCYLASFHFTHALSNRKCKII